MALSKILRSKLGFGAAPLGNMFRDIPEAEALATVEAAWNDGIRYFDNAPFYGAGLAELRLGGAVAGTKRPSGATDPSGPLSDAWTHRSIVDTPETMPELTPQQLEALKQGYPEYRKLKNITSRRGPSARMLAIINALDSKLAVRGKIEPEFFPMRSKAAHNENIVAQVKAAKIANQPANEKRAKEALDAFLKSTGGGPGAQGLKEELELFAAYLVAQAIPHGSVEWIPGPLKKLEKAMGKTATDYDYAYGANKDLVRGTLACTSQGSLAHIASLLMRTCTPELGMHLVKQDEQRSVRDGGQSTTGYSGWNFVVQFRDHTAFGAEIQANTFDVLYGKMAAKDFRSQLNVNEARYAQMQARMKFPGGLGHAFYDISEWGRNGTTEPEGTRATELAKDYNDACRGQFRETTLEKLNERVMGFGATLTSAKAQELWKHAITQSGWSALARQAHAKVVVPTAVRLGVR